MIRKSHTISILISIIFIFTSSLAICDIVYFDDRSVEGRIVEETNTEVVIETSIGKITIKKKKIKNIVRTKPEEDYLKLGNYYLSQKRYDAAIDYFNRALKVNPNYTAAKKALSKIKKIKEEEELKRQLEIESLKKEKDKEKERLEKKVGLLVDKIEGQFKIVHVVENSAADKTGVKPYDRLIVIGHTHTKDITFEKACELLMSKKPIYFTLERELNIVRKRVNYKKRTYVGIGIFVIKDNEKIVISQVIEGSPAAETGLKPQDRITRINGALTEGISLDKCEKLISNGELTSVNIVIRRDIRID